jgi:hypothetical protein
VANGFFFTEDSRKRLVAVGQLQVLHDSNLS